MAKDLGVDVMTLIQNEKREKDKAEKYITPTTGLPTLIRYIDELSKRWS